MWGILARAVRQLPKHAGRMDNVKKAEVGLDLAQAAAESIKEYRSEQEAIDPRFAQMQTEAQMLADAQAGGMAPNSTAPHGGIDTQVSAAALAALAGLAGLGREQQPNRYSQAAQLGNAAYPTLVFSNPILDKANAMQQRWASRQQYPSIGSTITEPTVIIPQFLQNALDRRGAEGAMVGAPHQAQPPRPVPYRQEPTLEYQRRHDLQRAKAERVLQQLGMTYDEALDYARQGKTIL